MIFQYGLNESDPDNFNRLLSAESIRGQAELVPGHGYIIYPTANNIFMLDNFFLQLTTGIVVGSRIVQFQAIDKGANVIFSVNSLVLQGPSVSVDYSFVRDVFPSIVASGNININLPSIPLHDVDYMTIFVGNIQAGDTFAGGWYNCRYLLLNR
jgi:hypothetical protein